MLDEKVENERCYPTDEGSICSRSYMVTTLLLIMDPRARCFILNPLWMIGLAAAKRSSGKGAGTNKGINTPEGMNNKHPT